MGSFSQCSRKFNFTGPSCSVTLNIRYAIYIQIYGACRLSNIKYSDKSANYGNCIDIFDITGRLSFQI
jgi:hypothetical protein